MSAEPPDLGGRTRPARPVRSRWLLLEPLADSPARLFCFPFAGAGASLYRRWPPRIGPMEVCAIQLPGRENRMREPAYQAFGDFADDAATALLPYLDRPFALFGHCMGALLAYALLVRLEERGLPLPVRLYVSSSLVPHAGPYGPLRPSMGDDRFVAELHRAARAMGLPEPLPDLVPLSCRVLRNDVRMCAGYYPLGPVSLPCPITTVGWTEDTDVPAREMEPWRDYGRVRHHLVRGDTFTFQFAPPPLLAALADDFST